MKLIILFFVIAGSIGLCHFTKTPQENIFKGTLPADSVNFKIQVQPILRKNCSPCHFPGGIMYKKMPFDNGQTLLAHEAGIIKRIKNEREANIISKYIRENKTGR
jgi:hypothetical protein